MLSQVWHFTCRHLVCFDVRWTKWPSANTTPISCYTVNWGGCKTFSFSENIYFFNYSVPTVWLDRFAVTCSISFSSVSILFLFLFILTVLTEWDSFYSEFAEEENHSREMGYVTITITIVFGATFLLLIFKVCHTTLLHWNNQFDRRLCVRFRLQLFAIFYFNLVLISQHHDTFYTSSSVFLLICLSIKSYKNYTWRRGGLFSFLLDAFSLVLVFV